MSTHSSISCATVSCCASGRLPGACGNPRYHARTLELRVSEGTTGALRTIQQVRDLAAVASSARVTFQGAPATSKREVLETVLCNLDVEEGHIASYQWKGPFALLEMESSGAFIHSRWAITTGLVSKPG